MGLKESFEARFFPLTYGRVALLAFLWLLVGFALGTETLMGPVRWTTDWARSHGWTWQREEANVRAIIALFVAGSFLVSLCLARILDRSRRRDVRLGIPLLAMAAAGASLFFWLNPQRFASDGADWLENDSGAEFTVGPYPAGDRMAELKHRGFTAVISLLHPAVVPFEPALLAEERAAAEKAGIELIHLPMLPWVSENREMLDRARGLVGTGGRYYIHCYLGKDRVTLVRQVIEKAGGTVAGTGTEGEGAPPRVRDLRDLPRFERGPFTELEPDVWLIPLPTDEEYLGFVLSARPRNIVSLLNPDNGDDRSWIEKERRMLEAAGVAFTVEGIGARPFSPETVLSLARKVRQMERPVMVHGFQTPSVESDAFLQAYRSDRPPLPPSLFAEPLAVGTVEVIAPNIAKGGIPLEPGALAQLAERGVRHFIYCDRIEAVSAGIQSDMAKAAGVEWSVWPPDAAAPADLAAGGPWYVYGPFADRRTHELAAAHGPAIPEVLAPGLARAAAEEAPDAEAACAPAAPSLRDGWKPWALAQRDRLLPPLKMWLLLSPFLLLYAGSCAAWAGWLRQSKGVRTPYTRKIFHFAIFTMAGLLQLVAGVQAVMLFGGITSLCVLYAVFRGAGFPFYEAMARPTDEPHRTFFILVPLATTALGGLLSNLFFGSWAAVGYLVGGWGDAVGEPFGTAFGKHRYRVPSLLGVRVTRSLEGSAAVFGAGFLGAMLILVLGGTPPATAIVAALACAAAGMAVEAVSSHGLDNLTTQLASSATAWVILEIWRFSI